MNIETFIPDPHFYNVGNIKSEVTSRCKSECVVKAPDYWARRRAEIAESADDAKFRETRRRPARDPLARLLRPDMATGANRKPPLIKRSRPEPRSMIPSTWPALEAAMHKWVGSGTYVISEYAVRRMYGL